MFFPLWCHLGDKLVALAMDYAFRACFPLLSFSIHYYCLRELRSFLSSAQSWFVAIKTAGWEMLQFL